MDYELAKKLKENGFRVDYGTEIPNKTICGEDECLPVPNLSELIEACLDYIPDKFLDIKSRGYTTKQWVATSSWKISSGSTPEEAVARLYLELKKK